MLQASTTWPELLERYAAYRAMPFWGAMTRIPDAAGHLRPEHQQAIAKDGVSAVNRVRRMIRRFHDHGGAAWPASPQVLFRDRAALDRLLAEVRAGDRSFRNFWDAVVFDRDSYACRYCGRDAFNFFQHTGKVRTLRLVVDHLDARGKRSGVYEPANSVTACWTCNTLKGALPEGVFLQELDWLIEARLRLKSRPGV